MKRCIYRLLTIMPLLSLVLWAQACQGVSPSFPNERTGESLDNTPTETDHGSLSNGAAPDSLNVTYPSLIDPSLTVETGEPLPPLNVDELANLTNGAQAQTQAWFDLAGLDKLIRPPFYTEDLQAFRAESAATHPDIAPFLGLWHDDGGAGSLYQLSIFSAAAPGQVCVLEYRPGLQVAGEVLLEPIVSLSTATVADGHLLGSRIRTTTTALRTGEFFTGDTVALLDVIDVDNTVRVFALQSPPTLPFDLPPDMVGVVSQALPESGCTTDILSTD